MLEKSLNRAAYVESDNWDIEKHKVFAGNEFQGVPEWVADTQAFKDAQKKDAGGLQAVVTPTGHSAGVVDREHLLSQVRAQQEEITTLRAQVASLQKTPGAKK